MSLVNCVCNRKVNVSGKMCMQQEGKKDCGLSNVLFWTS